MAFRRDGGTANAIVIVANLKAARNQQKLAPWIRWCFLFLCGWVEREKKDVGSAGVGGLFQQSSLFVK